MDASTPTEPNYVLSPTIQCYDCHDYHGGGSGIDDLPPISQFNNSHKPQNIAFGFTKNGTGSMTEDPPAGSVSGYYENKPPYLTAPSTNLGADPNLNPSDNASLLKTGGHYFKTKDPTGTSSDGFDLGDKLPCRDCHSPHEYSTNWQAFIRKDLPISNAVGSLTNVYASSFMANSFTSGSRSDSESRKICAACHAYSNLGTPVKFSDISPQYTVGSPNTIVQPPGTIAEHLSSSTVACVSCHNHNAIDASCGDCHGFPPPGYPTGKNPETASPPTPYGVTPEQAHARHVGHQNGSGTAFSKYSFQCNVCHANSAMGTKTPSNHGSDNVDVDFDFSTLATTRAWIDTTPTGHPAHFQPFTGSAYTRTTCGPGGRGGVYCHSDGHDNTATTGYYKNVTWGTASLKCFGCHGNPAYDNANIRYGMPDAADHPNSHSKHVVDNGYECSVCHYNTATGQYLNQTRAIAGSTNVYHVNGKLDVDFDPVHPGSYTAATKTCSVSACHGGGTPQWGGAISGCSDCHLSSSPDSDVYLNHTTSNNIYDSNQAGNINSTEWLYSGHGKTTTPYDVSGHPAANFTGGDPCYFCHNPYALHDNTSNPFRLKDQTGAAAYLSSKGWNATCLVCHFHSTAPIGYNPFGGANVKATAAFADNAHYGGKHGTGNNAGKFCWDCHDPHGDRPSSGVNNIYMIQGGSPRGGTAMGTLLRQSDGTYGFRGTTANAMTTNAPVFVAASTGTDYVDNTNTSKNGICQVCHTTASHWTATSGDGHNAGTRCTQCHTHDTGFAPSDCSGCHGGSDGTTGVASAPFLTMYWGASASTNPVKSGHGKFSTGSPSRPIRCEDCHDIGSPNPSTHSDGTGVFHTQNWPGKTPDTTNQNTSHLSAAYFPGGAAGFRYEYSLKVNQQCGRGCHASAPHNHHPSVPAGSTNSVDNTLRFGDFNTVANPKSKTWYAITNFPSEFYMSRSPWVDRDTTSLAGGGFPDAGTVYGSCVSCHDPHGTNAPSNLLGTTSNRMLRGDSTNPGQFCNKACH
jgi:predicted CxxxxCH...CXXCH cytochrome family protein